MGGWGARDPHFVGLGGNGELTGPHSLSVVGIRGNGEMGRWGVKMLPMLSSRSPIPNIMDKSKSYMFPVLVRSLVLRLEINFVMDSDR